MTWSQCNYVQPTYLNELTKLSRDKRHLSCHDSSYRGLSIHVRKVLINSRGKRKCEANWHSIAICSFVCYAHWSGKIRVTSAAGFHLSVMNIKKSIAIIIIVVLFYKSNFSSSTIRCLMSHLVGWDFHFFFGMNREGSNHLWEVSRINN